MKKLKSLSIFFPAFNDAYILPRLVEKAHNVAQRIAERFEVIVVNDGSTDSTKDVLEKLKKKYPSFLVVHHQKNRGYGAALISGFKNVKYEWVFYTDGDGQYSPEELTLLVGALTTGVDVVNGYKLKRADNVFRKLIGGLYNWLVHQLYVLPIGDVDCDFRLIRQSLLKKVNLTSSSGIICLELITKLQRAGAQFAEVGVHHYKRPYGGSKFFTLKSIVKTIYDNIVFFFGY